MPRVRRRCQLPGLGAERPTPGADGVGPTRRARCADLCAAAEGSARPVRGGDVLPFIATEVEPALGQGEGFLLVVALVTPLDPAVRTALTSFDHPPTPAVGDHIYVAPRNAAPRSVPPVPCYPLHVPDAIAHTFDRTSSSRENAARGR